MKNHSPEVDAYIAEAAPFARPILKKIRAIFHKAHPEMQETIKWGFPHFEYKGLVGSMAAFKKHVGFGFWKGSLMKDPLNLFSGVGDTTMNARKLTDVSELPDEDTLIRYVEEAIELNENNVKITKPKRKGPTKELAVPDYFLAALKKNKKALAAFEEFSPSHRNEYVEWITEAKQQATREKRISSAIELMTEGKSRHWKYQK
jgi:uncharacterized protein YdeI (YjbR/CyaY-like superfamily)